MLTRRSILAGAAGLAAAGHWPASEAAAQAIEKPMRLVVGFPPGGSADTIARLLAAEMKDYAATIVVDNRPGAGGRIGLENLKASGADGANMIITPASAIVLYPHVYKKLSYVPLKDFTPISSVCSSPFSLTVGPKVPASVKTVADFVAWCKANPKEASYGSSGAGSMPHFAGVMFARAAGFDFLHVPYRGAAPAIQDLLGGQIAANMAVLSTALPNILSGELRSIALTGAARSTFLPDVPTLAEAGFKDIVVEEWFGIFAPAGLPTEIVDRLNKSINAAIKSKSVMEGFSKFSFTSGGESAADFARIVKADLERWAPIVSASGFAPEE